MADIEKFYDAEESHVVFESHHNQGDLGLTGYVLDNVSMDTVVLDMVDVESGLKKVGEFYQAANTDIKAWRRGVVIMVGPSVKHYSVGDMVIFPGVRGLDAGKLAYTDSMGNTSYTENATFLQEKIIFGKVHEA